MQVTARAVHVRRRSMFRGTKALTGGLSVLAVAAVLAGCTSGKSSGGSSSSADGATSGVAGTPSGNGSSSSAQAAPAAVITTSASAETPISPTDPVTVSIANGELTAVTMLNPAGKSVQGQLAADKSSWRLAEPLGYGKTYRLTARGANAEGVSVTKTATVATVEPDNFTMPSITDVYGTSIGKGNTYGVGMIVRVHFDEPVDEKVAEKSLSVTTTPNVTGGWYWRDAQNAFWRPQSYYPANTKVAVTADVYGKKLGDGLYGQDDKSASFTIGQKRVSIANGKTHDVKVYFDDKLVRTMPTSMGKGGYEPGNSSINYWTMKGNYTVINHENPAIMSSASFGVEKGSPNYYDKLKVPYSTKVSTDGIYLHEKNDTAWAQGNQNVSHGCLNLVHKHAKWFFDNTRVGDVVTMVKTGGPTISFDQGGQWSVSWADWQKGSALR